MRTKKCSCYADLIPNLKIYWIKSFNCTSIEKAKKKKRHKTNCQLMQCSQLFQNLIIGGHDEVLFCYWRVPGHAEWLGVLLKPVRTHHLQVVQWWLGQIVLNLNTSESCEWIAVKWIIQYHSLFFNSIVYYAQSSGFNYFPSEQFQ